MAKVSQESRELFYKKMKPYKEVIAKLFENEKTVKKSMSENAEGVQYKKYELAEDQMYIATLYITINNLSVELLDVKNTDALNEARKSLYQAVIYLEEIVTDYIDVPYSDYAENVEAISDITIEKKYFTVRKLGLAIRLVMDAFGENTKWKWSFVDLMGRFTIVAKNLMDLREAGKVFLDPSDPNYRVTVFYLRLVRKLLAQSADGFRDKYELSTQRADDLQAGINFAMALRRICVIMNDPNEADVQKKKAAVWKEKIDSDKKKGICK